MPRYSTIGPAALFPWSSKKNLPEWASKQKWKLLLVGNDIWQDHWQGMYYDSKNKILYVAPVPRFVMSFKWEGKK